MGLKLIACHACLIADRRRKEPMTISGYEKFESLSILAGKEIVKILKTLLLDAVAFAKENLVETTKLKSLVTGLKYCKEMAEGLSMKKVIDHNDHMTKKKEEAACCELLMTKFELNYKTWHASAKYQKTRN